MRWAPEHWAYRLVVEFDDQNRLAGLLISEAIADALIGEGEQ